VLFDYLWRWLARMVQFPAEPGRTVIVLRGRQRIGKGYFVNMIGRLIHHHYLTVTQPGQLAGRFNSHLADCVLLFADEAVFAGDPKMAGQLKALATEKIIAVEQKFRDLKNVRNRLHCIWATNEAWAVPTDKTGEAARYLVLDVVRRFNEADEDDRSMKRMMFEEIDHEMLKAGGLERLLYELRQVDLSDFDVEKVPVTAGLVDQKLRSIDDVGQWWHGILCDGDVLPNDEFDTPEWDKKAREVVIDGLYDNYERWCDNQRPRVFAPKVKAHWSEWLAKLLDVDTLKIIQHRSDGRKRRYVIPPLTACRNAFEKFVGGKVEWPRVEEVE
jgi:phage/plasmid-associated DNA primase